MNSVKPFRVFFCVYLMNTMLCDLDHPFQELVRVYVLAFLHFIDEEMFFVSFVYIEILLHCIFIF